MGFALRDCVCVCAAARDIVLQHLWNGRTTVDDPLQLSHPPEQLRANNDTVQGRSNSNRMDIQSHDDDAEVLLERFGYKVFFGGVYSVEDYRAM